MTNVHCSGSLCMISACQEVPCQRIGLQSFLIGVTVLTSMEQDDLARNRSGCEVPGTEVPFGGAGHGRTGMFRAVGPGN